MQSVTDVPPPRNEPVHSYAPGSVERTLLTDQLAEQWGARIARTGVLEHRDQREVIRRCDNSWAGETLVRGTNLSPEAMVSLWLDSPGHREILLSPRAKRAGVAITRDAQGRTIGVVNLVRHSS